MEYKNIVIFLIFLSSSSFLTIHAQLGLCSGNSGDPIFTETFDTGTINNALPPGTTTYEYTNGYPLDGFYTVSNGTFGNGFDWHQIQDHTPDDLNGKCLIVNAATAPGEFYRTQITGLCENTTYGFSAWLINLVRVPGFCVNQGIAIPVNVSFEIWDSTGSTLLETRNTGDIIESETPDWQEYGVLFQTLPGQDAVILKMINNGGGGCGNDLAIDDIEFKSCGDFVAVRDESDNSAVSLCSSQTPYTTTLTATPDGTVFSDHFYQWQESVDGISWIDIPVTDQSINIAPVSASTYYRTKIAEFASNLENPNCFSVSESYQITVNPDPVIPPLECWETAMINPATCQWDVTGTQPAKPFLECWETASFNAATCQWDVMGTQPDQPAIECWQTATFDNTACLWNITGTQPGDITEEDRTLCTGAILRLQPQTDIPDPGYVWNTGEFTGEIAVSEPGVYMVDITDDLFCSYETIIYNVSYIETPIIESVDSNGNAIVVSTNSEDHLYSLDGVTFQSDNIFSDILGGKYTIYVKNRDCDATVQMSHIHFYIPKFFTPNNDGINDTFILSGVESFGSSRVSVFNRQGRLLKVSTNSSFIWDGTFNNRDMPAGDYWYLIVIEGQKFSGHIALKR